MLKPASVVKKEIPTSLDLIGKAIQQSVNLGHTILLLYEDDPNRLHKGYKRKFHYSNNDLIKLMEMGYKVAVGERETIYAGMWWWKKKITEIEYHYISW